MIVDCASGDGSLERRAPQRPAGIPFQAVALAENRGFAGGMNAALARTTAPFVLTLNADARPQPDFVTRLLGRASRRRSRAAPRRRRHRPPGAARGGRRAARASTPAACASPATWRHLDRGSGELDRGQYARARAGVRRHRRRLALPPRGAPRRRDRRRGLRPALPLLPRGRRALLPPARARLGGALRAGGRRRAPPRESSPSGAPRCRRRSTTTRSRTATSCASTTRPPATSSRPCRRRWRATSLALGYVLLRERSSLAGLRLALAPPARAPRAGGGDPGPAHACRARAIDRWFLRARGCRCDAPSAALRVALLGSRGIPARYGGYETLMEELARAPRRARLRGHRLLPLALHAARPRPLPRRRARGAPDAAHQAPRHAGPHPPLLPPRRRRAATTRRWSSTPPTRSSCRCSASPACRSRSTSTASRSGAPSGARSAAPSTPLSERLACVAARRPGHRRRGHPPPLPATATAPTSVAHRLRRRPAPARPSTASSRRLGLAPPRLLPLRQPLRAREQPAPRRRRLPRRSAATCRWSWSAARPTPPPSSAPSPRAPTRASASPARSTARATASCCRTPSPTSTPPRSAAPIRRWSRPWATATASWSTTRPRTARSPATPRSTSTPPTPPPSPRALERVRTDPDLARSAAARRRARPRASSTGSGSPTTTPRSSGGWPGTVDSRSWPGIDEKPFLHVTISNMAQARTSSLANAGRC